MAKVKSPKAVPARPEPVSQPKSPRTQGGQSPLTPEERAERSRRQADAKRARAAKEAENQKRAEARAAALKARYERLREAEKQQRREEFLAKRRAEAAAVRNDVSILPTAALLELWQQYLGYVTARTVRPSAAEWIDEVRDIPGIIEAEWQRRSKLFKSHPDYFIWPSTFAPKGAGALTSGGWTPQGVLSYLGYHVGHHADLTDTARQALLHRVFEMHLPPFGSPQYLEEWGAPRSAQRLRKLAESIASFARQAKRKTAANLHRAIAEWEADLAYLYKEFYVQRLAFGWPHT